ncbi:hypothetical protein LJK88_23895 [Paenibacillus sp. P26]|nr:hypothetical protein LJK88_23895 [Paenibacillus sp. P26]
MTGTPLSSKKSPAHLCAPDPHFPLRIRLLLPRAQGTFVSRLIDTHDFIDAYLFQLIHVAAPFAQIPLARDEFGQILIAGLLQRLPCRRNDFQLLLRQSRTRRCWLSYLTACL